MVRDERKDMLKSRILEAGLDLFCDIPYDPAIPDVLFNGKSLADIGETPIMNHIYNIIDVIGGYYGNT
jgi:hypothetical protein